MSRSRLTHTPYLDGWRARLEAATEGRGRKAELARHLAAARGQSIQVWTVGIARILARRVIPNGEDVLEISAWMEAFPAAGNHHPTPRTAPATDASL